MVNLTGLQVLATELASEVDELRSERDAVLAKLAKARKALQWYADNFVVNGSRAAAVLAELEEPHNG